MKLTMLGTGHALVTECYNTCFVLSENDRYFLVDGGGGSALLRQLKHAGIDWRKIKGVFVTHQHLDHITGIIWILRVVCSEMNKNSSAEDISIYAHAELIKTIDELGKMLLQSDEARFIGTKVHLVPVGDGETKAIIGHNVTFFDVHSTKMKQYGFSMELEKGTRLSCCGDEPYNGSERQYVEGSKWLLHEAFCLHSQAARFRPYEKHHSTVKDACQAAERLHVQNLLLYHTEDENLSRRRELYTQEGQQYFSGKLFVPDDLESFEL